MSARTLERAQKQPQGAAVGRHPAAGTRAGRQASREDAGQEENPLRAGRPGVRSRGARRFFKLSSGFARHAAKKSVPRSLGSPGSPCIVCA